MLMQKSNNMRGNSKKNDAYMSDNLWLKMKLLIEKRII